MAVENNITPQLINNLSDLGIDANNAYKFSGFEDAAAFTSNCLKYAEAVGLTQNTFVPRLSNPARVSGRLAANLASSAPSTVSLLPNQEFITNPSDGSIIGILEKNSDGTVEIFLAKGDNTFEPIPTNCGCCEQLARDFQLTGVFFDVATQSCRWKTATCDAPDDIFKIVLNSTGTDGSIFSEDTGEDCTLVIDFDYLFKFDCESLTKLITTQGGIGTCSNVVDLLESLKATVTIDVVDPINGTGTLKLREVFSDVIFPEIGQGNLYNYLTANGDFTGFFVCDKLLNQNPNDNTCYPLNIYNLNTNGSQVNCSTFVSNLISTLYAQANLNQNNTADRKIFESNVSENSFKSEWSKYAFEITDENVLNQIKNEKIKLSVKIEGNCINSCVYFDNIKLEKKCTKVERKNIFISKTPGFDLDRIIDNKKSWVEVDEKTRRTFYIAKTDNTEKIRYTDYYLLDSEQVINTKEIDLDINIASAIETDLWDYIYDNNCLLTGETIVNTGATFPIVTKDSYGNNITLPMTTVPVDCDNTTPGQAFIFGIWNKNFQQCQKLISSGVIINLNAFCYCNEPITYNCYENHSIVRLRVNVVNDIYKEFWVTCEKSGNTSQNRFYYVEDNSGIVAISGVTGYITDDCIDEYNSIREAYLKDGYYTPDILKKDKDGNCVDCGCGECDGSPDCVDFNELFTLSLDTIDTLEDFKYFATSQLIDAKNRKTLSAYPTLNLLYERYLNSNKYCTNLSSSFTYKTMDQFADLIGNYWVDLVEQVIPATTIWGATRVYSNTIFDSQKFQYKQGSILFGETTVSMEYPSPVIAVSPCSSVTATTTTIQGSFVGTQNSTQYDRIYYVQYNTGSEFIGSVGIIGTGGGGSGQPSNIVNDCLIGVTIVGENPDFSLSNGTATANVIGDVQQDDIVYEWNNGATGQTITNLSAGTYSVTVWDKDKPDCKAIDMITLIEV